MSSLHFLLRVSTWAALPYRPTLPPKTPGGAWQCQDVNEHRTHGRDCLRGPAASRDMLFSVSVVEAALIVALALIVIYLASWLYWGVRRVKDLERRVESLESKVAESG